MRFCGLIAMHDAALVGVLQTQPPPAARSASLLNVQPAVFLDDLGKRSAGDVLHHQEMQLAGLIGVVGIDDVRMGETRGRLHFAAKTLHGDGAVNQFRTDDLQGDPRP